MFGNTHTEFTSSRASSANLSSNTEITLKSFDTDEALTERLMLRANLPDDGFAASRVFGGEISMCGICIQPLAFHSPSAWAHGLFT